MIKVLGAAGAAGPAEIGLLTGVLSTLSVCTNRDGGGRRFSSGSLLADRLGGACLEGREPLLDLGEFTEVLELVELGI